MLGKEGVLRVGEGKLVVGVNGLFSPKDEEHGGLGMRLIEEFFYCLF